jgi:hypothetical protein
MPGSGRTTEQMVDLSMRACQEHEGRMREALRSERGRRVEAELPGFRDFVRDRAITQVNERRQRAAQPAPGEAPHEAFVPFRNREAAAPFVRREKHR